ncbi:MAG: 2-polyprenylphenol 6-hydroxylase [Magnetococcus sp. WYHC-3]
MGHSLGTLRRLWVILLTLVRHDLEPVSQRLWPYRLLALVVGLWPGVRQQRRRHPAAVRLRLALEELGPTFIKFGQALSTRIETLPEEYGRELKRLQDDVPPFPVAQVRQAIESNLGQPLDQFFSRFDPTPVASASIAQVHRAETLDGHTVAVKVLRPNVPLLVAQDIRLLSRLARFIEANVPAWSRFRATRVVEEFADTIQNEMNFHVEAARAQQLRDNLARDPGIFIPRVYWPLSRQGVLTMEWVDGRPVDDVARGYPGSPDPAVVAENLITSFFQQVFRDGYFHADQHPGNLLVMADGRIALVDFGIIGQVSLQSRLWLADMLHGFITRDYRKVARVHLDAGYISPETDLAEFEEACRQIGEPWFGQPLKDISIGQLLAQLFKTTERFQMQVQPQLLLLQKTMLTLEGVGRELSPNLNAWMMAEPLVKAWMKDNLGARGQLRSFKRGMEHLMGSSLYLPQLLHDGLERMAHGRIQVLLHPHSLKRLESQIYTGQRRLTGAIIGGALFIGGCILVAGGASAWWYAPPLTVALVKVVMAKRAAR